MASGKKSNSSVVGKLREVITSRGRLAKNSATTVAEGLEAKPMDFAVAFIILAIAMFIFMPSSRLVSINFQEGDIIPSNIYAPADILTEDTASTDKNRLEAKQASPDVYDLDGAIGSEKLGAIAAAFPIMEELYIKQRPRSYRFILSELGGSELVRLDSSAGMRQERQAHHSAIASLENSRMYAKAVAKFEQSIGVKLSSRAKRVLRWHHYRPQIGEWLQTLLGEIYGAGLVADKASGFGSGKAGIMVGKLGGDSRGFKELADVYSIKSGKLYAKQRLAELVPSRYPSLRGELLGIISSMLSPNIFLNKAKTVDAQKAAFSGEALVFFQVKKGELLLRGGESITAKGLQKVEAVKEELKKSRKLQSLFGTLLLLVIIFGSAFAFLYIMVPEIGRNKPLLLLLSVLYLLQLSLMRGMADAASIFAQHNAEMLFGSYIYAAPLAVATMLSALFFNRQITMMMTLAMMISTGLMYGSSGHYHWVVLVSGLAMLPYVGRIKVRNDVWHMGLYISGAAIAAVLVGDMLSNELGSRQSLYNLSMVVIGVFLAVILTLALLPLLERFFPVVSGIKLLELSDLNHPLLSKMAVVAPGTYHHSIVVGNLAEDAAEVVGGDPLLARVGSYFHDIGKIEKPDYYIENQISGKNRHDDLNPSMSSLIITSHVTSGIELAKKYKLIPQLQDFILEHHGTQTVKYFYQRAKEQSGGSAVSEHDFKYPGRVPQSKESAIVALADSVEAATRTIKNPTPAKLRQITFKIIQEKFLGGQLDESQLTLRDLKKIGDSFVGILHGIFHYRVEYPEDKDDKSPDNKKIWSENA